MFSKTSEATGTPKGCLRLRFFWFHSNKLTFIKGIGCDFEHTSESENINLIFWVIHLSPKSHMKKSGNRRNINKYEIIRESSTIYGA